MRLIDADKLVDMLYDSEYTTLCPLDEVCGVIDACPTAEFAPVQNGELRDAAAQVTRMAAEAAVEREWISVEDRLPEDRSNVLVVAYWCERWGVYMGWCAPERAEWSVHVGIGDRDDVAVTHWMPLPAPPKEVEE